MNTFFQWVEGHNLELDESTKRAGIAWWAYPDGYIRSHYPDLWFTPSAADAIQKMAPGPPFTKYKHHVHHKTPPDYAIAPDGGTREEPGKEYETD